MQKGSRMQLHNGPLPGHRSSLALAPLAARNWRIATCTSISIPNMPPLSRLQQLLQHLNPDRAVGEPGQLSTQDCAARGHALPRFDVEFLEEYLDEYKDLKKEIYGKLATRQDLLVATVEGLTKGLG